jgi:large subunit ribosomal protein L29
MFRLRFQFATRQLTNTSRIRTIRRDIARVLTLQRQQELAAGGR